MDITIKADSTGFGMANREVEIKGIDVFDLIKKVISKTGIDGLMDIIRETISDNELTELAVWLDMKYDYNFLIDELDDEKRQEEILKQLIINLN